MTMCTALPPLPGTQRSCYPQTRLVIQSQTSHRPVAVTQMPSSAVSCDGIHKMYSV